MRPLFCSSFRDITPTMAQIAGGKGATLARLYQAGYPVPDGFIIPSAFSRNQLLPEAFDDIRRMLDQLRQD